MAQRLPLTDVVLTTVKPLEKTSHVEIIDPTSLDLASADAFVPLFFAYRLVDQSDALYLQFLKRIKHSLQRALIPFFSFAGRWIAIPKGSSGRRLHCNDEGVPFVEAFLDKDLDSIVHASSDFQPVPELQGYGALGMDETQFRQEMKDGGLPCIFVQVTRFKCGGLVVAVTFNHMHTDGKGLFNFMTAWSDLSRSNETTITVDHDRASADKASFQNFLTKHRNPNLTSAVHGRELPPAKLGQWAMKAFEVKASTIQSLKQEAEQGAKDGGPGFVSTGDCIIAHVWKSLARLPSSLLGGKELAISMAVEGRSKFFDRPLPNLCGNAVAAMVAPKIPPGDLRDMSVASVASKLRAKLHTTAREEWLGEDRLEEAFLVSRGGQFACVRATSWFGFPMYEIDFGVGRPYFASGVNSHFIFRGIGTLYIGPSIPSSAASIASLSIWSTSQLLEALESDPQFNTWFLPRGKSTVSSSS